MARNWPLSRSGRDGAGGAREGRAGACPTMRAGGDRGACRRARARGARPWPPSGSRRRGRWRRSARRGVKRSRGSRPKWRRSWQRTREGPGGAGAGPAAKELVAAGARERERAVESAKSQADLEVLAERQVALEARAVAESRTLAERERALEKTRLEVRDLALELGRIALRTQSWEKARGISSKLRKPTRAAARPGTGLGRRSSSSGSTRNRSRCTKRPKKYIN